MITIETAKGEDVVAAADAALKARLYVSGWALSDHLRCIRSIPGYGRVVVLAKEDNIPVGVGVLIKDNVAMFFVRKNKRGQGIGKMLADKIAQEYNGTRIRVFPTRVPGSKQLLNKYPEFCPAWY